MLQVPPTGAPTARVPSRAPQSDPSDPAFAGLMAQAGLTGPLPAARAPETPARATGNEASAVSQDRAARKSGPAQEGRAEEASAPERPESSDTAPEAEKEAGQASAAPAAPDASQPAPVVPEGRAIPLMAEAAALPQAPMAAAPAPVNEALPPASNPVSGISKGAEDALPQPPIPAEAKATAAPPTEESIPAPAPKASTPEPIRALPAPAPVSAPPKAERAVEAPVPRPEQAQAAAPLPPTPAGETMAKAGPGPIAQAAQGSIQPQRPEADAPAPSGKSAGFQNADAGPRIQEPNPSGSGQNSAGDLAQGLKERLTLMAETAQAAPKGPQPAFQLPGTVLEAPTPSSLLKPHAAAPADDAPRKAADAPPAQAASEPKPSGSAASGPKDPGVALPRTESMGLQPAQGGASPVASLQSAPTKAPAQLQWQAPVPSLVNQVEGGIRWMLRSSSQGAELQLHPENLGRVRIELRVEGSEVHARVWASDPKSLPVLQDNKAFLEVSLKEQGLNLGSFDLRQNSQQAQTRQQSGEGSGQFWATEAPKADFRQETPILAGAVAAQARRLEVFA